MASTSQVSQFRSSDDEKKTTHIESNVVAFFDSKRTAAFNTIVQDTKSFIQALKRLGIAENAISVYMPTNAVTFRCTGRQVDDVIKNVSGIQYVGLANGPPKLEASINYMDLSVNRINAVHAEHPELNGEGIQVSIKEQFMDTTDIDLKGRYFSVGLESELVSQHANFMATMIAGAGNTYHLGRGTAGLTSFTSSDFTSTFPDENEILETHEISVQNHSYGFDVDNRYSAETQAYDHQLFTLPELMHVFSAGNKGTEVSEEGIYVGIEGYANLSGSQKMAKNALVVGATNRFGVRDGRSSAGPTYDGRVKPDLMAYGQEGSSDAAALVSGASVLIQDWYKQKYDQLPPSDVVKAVLIAGANEYDDPISFKTGYGKLNSLKSIEILQGDQFEIGAVQKGFPSIFELILPADQSKLRLVLCWTDIAGVAGADQALVNDLDIKIKDPSNQEWLPWVLDYSPNTASLSGSPIRGIDSRNNVELITLDSPEAGTYTVSITTDSQMDIPQNFALAYYVDELDSFEWTFPTSEDICLVNNELVFRWDGNLVEDGKLEMRNNSGEWIALSENIDLTDSYFSWTTDQPYIKTQLRMIVGAKRFLSDEFNILKETELNVDYDCENKFKLIWEKDDLAKGYELYHLSDKMLELNQTVSDTFLVLSKTANPSLNYAVQPVYSNVSNYRFRTIDYSQQGVNCYYENFTATLIDDSYVMNDISLTSITDIASVEFFNWKDGVSNLILSVEDVETALSADDADPREGVNGYFAQINLKDGTEVQTDTTSIYFTNENTLIVFPNPISKNNFLSVLSGQPGATLQLLNTRGELLFEDEVFFDFAEISINDLPEGIYILRLYHDGDNISHAKLMVTD